MTTEKIYLDLNPANEEPHFLGLIVERPTGVFYGNQTGGLACLWRQLEGYLVVLGTGSLAALYINFFARFHGRPPFTASGWTSDDLAELELLVSETAVHRGVTDAFGRGEHSVSVRLDRRRIQHLSEGWVPVVVGEERGVLTFPNSD